MKKSHIPEKGPVHYWVQHILVLHYRPLIFCFGTHSSLVQNAEIQRTYHMVS